METEPRDNPKKTAQPGEDSPLSVKEPEVTRFNRRVVFILAVVASSIFAFSLVATFSPKKRVQGQETPASDKYKKNQQSPDLPDPVASAPGNYNELGGTRSSPVAFRGNSAGNSAAPGQSAVGQSQGPAYGNHVGATPEEQAKAKEQEQTTKDAMSAINSPISFNLSETSQQTKPEQPARNDVVVPPVPGLEKLAERMPNNVGSDDQNMQGEKRNFSGERGADFPYLKTTLIAPLSQYEIKAGSILPAILITGINSDLPGQLVAQVRENVFDTVTGNYLLIPQGTRLIGEYDSKIAFGQERILVVWTRLIMPNGDSIGLEGMPGTDLSGYAGMTGKVNNHYGKLVTGVVLGSMIGAGAQVAVGGQGAPNVPPSFGQLAVSGAAQNINQTAQQHTQKVLNLQPTIEVSPGDKINVFVTKDMILKPFTEEMP